MARGWESKDVESQAEERLAQREAQRAAANKAELTHTMEDAARRKSALELDRTRIEQEMASTQHPRRRAQLQAALAHLDGELKKLD